MVEGEEGHCGRHDREDDHEPGLVSSQLNRGRMELADRCECRSGQEGRRLYRLEDMARTGVGSAVFYSGKVKPTTGNDGSGEPVNRTSARVVDECRISAKSAETPVVIAF